MKNSKAERVQTTLGELVTVLCEESQKLFSFKRNERQLVVAYILNDLVKKSISPKHRIRAGKHG
jgi:hypothetical protein